MDSLKLARTALDAASDEQALDIVLLDTREVCSFTDYFVICSGNSVPHMKAIQEAVLEAVRKEERLPDHIEGTADSGWMLLDFGDVIIHIFSAAERDRYQLDDLWSKAHLLIKMI